MTTETNTDKKDDNPIYNNANGKIHDEEKNIEPTFLDDDLELISAAVNTNDDPTLPCLTFRFWLLSTCIIIVRRFTGPFNYKEHACILVAVGSGGLSAYAVDIISVQELFYNTRVNFLTGFLLLISTQMIGYGLTGFVRKCAGVLNFSFDWNAIGSSALVTPCDAKKFPFISPLSFDKDGNIVIDPITGALNVTAYENYSPVYITATLANFYGMSFMIIPATICHVILFYGKELWNQYKKTREEENSDIHCKMMDVYPEVPHYWYTSIFVVMLIIALILCYTTGANLPWWGLLLAVAISAFMILPVGVIQAISNQGIGLNVIAELLCGFILPGRPIANVYFKTYSTITLFQCLSFVEDLKLGHYLKIPPRSMFISQIWGTFVGIIVNYWTLNVLINTKRPYLDGTEADPSGQWAGLGSEAFNTASIIWGLIGPARTFGPDSMYNILLWGFLIGGFLPIPFYFLHKRFPKSKFNLINMPIILQGLCGLVTGYPNFIVSGFIAGFISQFYTRRYRKGWWMKYNYVMAAAFDSGAQIMTMVQFPTWWGNDPSTQNEHCFPID
ncbi:21086_t:CDS:10, partial [Racocetra persica]